MISTAGTPGNDIDAQGSWTLVTGGAGFVGSNLADRLARDGRRVRILDNLSRAGVESNAQWLRQRHGDRIELVRADVRDRSAIETALKDVTAVFHFAAQVAVTSSLDDPRQDFQINLGATFELLEAIRHRARPPHLFFTSTNKVYGALEDVELAKDGSRYWPASPEVGRRGISEARPLDFHSPYGCSKGGADQYVLDYSRTYGLDTVVFRMSCIYGPRQFGNEDQGWVAHFLLRALAGESLTLYGDGRQVRDILFVDDLVEAFLCAERQMPVVSRQAFNVGGGPDNALSLLELLDLIEGLTGQRPRVEHAPARVGDQRYYVSDTRRLERLTGWRPRVPVHQGVVRLHEWLSKLVAPSVKVPEPPIPTRVAQEVEVLG